MIFLAAEITVLANEATVVAAEAVFLTAKTIVEAAETSTEAAASWALPLNFLTEFIPSPVSSLQVAQVWILHDLRSIMEPIRVELNSLQSTAGRPDETESMASGCSIHTLSP